MRLAFFFFLLLRYCLSSHAAKSESNEGERKEEVWTENKKNGDLCVLFFSKQDISRLASIFFSATFKKSSSFFFSPILTLFLFSTFFLVLRASSSIQNFQSS